MSWSWSLEGGLRLCKCYTFNSGVHYRAASRSAAAVRLHEGLQAEICFCESSKIKRWCSCPARGRQGPWSKGRPLPFGPVAFGGPRVDKRGLGTVEFPQPEGGRGDLVRAAQAAAWSLALRLRAGLALLESGGNSPAALPVGEGFGPGLGLLRTQLHFITAQGRES